MKKILLIFKLLIFNLSRKINKVFILPISYTYSVTSLCDSKCKTCMIWKNKNKNDLELNEWEKIIKNIGNVPYWVTITGGNQFLRKDILDFINLIIKYNKPLVINIPVSCINPKLILSNIKSILKLINNKKIKLILNISIDGIGKQHDYIRGIDGSFNTSIYTINELKKLKKNNSNLIVGTYTIISKYNIDNFLDIFEYIQNKIKPDNYGFEISEKRKELFNLNNDFMPNNNEILNIFKKNINLKSKGIFIKIKNYLRNKYYKNVFLTLKKNKEIIPCFAGISSIQISSSGNVWQCCTKTNDFGDLRKENYNFKKIFFSKNATKLREKIKKEKCFCTHSNVYYTNMMCNLK